MFRGRVVLLPIGEFLFGRTIVVRRGNGNGNGNNGNGHNNNGRNHR